MPSYRSSSGDPARTLALLWREPGFGRSGRGPRQGRSVDDVVTAAIAIADERGLDSVSMRGIGQSLGVAPMSVYTYVPGKTELLDLMLDSIYRDLPRHPFGATAPWRDRIGAVADANRALFRAHPWATAVTTARPPLGPGLMAKYEHELSAFDDLGLDDVTVDDALTHLLTFVRATSHAEHDVRNAELDSALNDEQWWAANAPLLARVFDAESYPRAARIGSATGEAHGSAYDPEHAYRFGLQQIMAGLAQLIDEATPKSRARRRPTARGI
ncbi:MAG TPA: TetR/AcrR family transcriptional regulator [Mycobacteriales bacterium]|nr:TetR/AcrR family transcriptional regulator [Mycobacteriales bacterium]